MTKEELFEKHNIAVENYGSGFILADYNPRFLNGLYSGVSFNWRNQPVVKDPFPTEQAAIDAIEAKL